MAVQGTATLIALTTDRAVHTFTQKRVRVSSALNYEGHLPPAARLAYRLMLLHFGPSVMLSWASR